MASRNGGPGRDDASGSGSADPLGHPSTDPHVPSTADRTQCTIDHGDRDSYRSVRRSSPRQLAGYREREANGRNTGIGSDTRPIHSRVAIGPGIGHRTDIDPPIRDPGRYALTDHFRNRLGQPGRYVTTKAVSEAIRTGQLRWNSTDGWRFALVQDGIRVVVVVGDTETRSPVVVTAWTEIADRDAANASPRWAPTDVDTNGIRTALSESPETPIPDQIRVHHVDRPFEIGSHRLETAPGEPFIRCLTCRGRFRSKSQLLERHCRSRTAAD